MNAFQSFNSFRVRLLLVLATLLVATLGVQFYLNRYNERRIANLLAEQERAWTGGTSLAIQSFSGARLEELDKEPQFRLREKFGGRVANILIIRDEGRVPGQLDAADPIDDSLNPDLNPVQLEDGAIREFTVADARLPRLVNADRAAITQTVAGEPRAFTIPAKTDKGLNYIIVVLGSAPTEPGIRPLLPTLVVLLTAVFVTSFLVWRFTRPISELSDAARRVAAGDFNFRVPSATRPDEMGALARVFNEMIAQLGRLRELEGRLHQVERSAVVGRLASAIAHEIRNPLNYINLTLDHLHTALAPEDEHKRAVVARLIDQLKTEVARINTRITEFLKFTRPAKLTLRPVDLRATLEDALRLVEAQAAECGVEARFEQRGEVPPVSGDAESLRSLFTNLIINSVQAMENGHRAGSRLTVTLTADQPGRACVEISDTGRGIPQDDLPQIFEPYFSTKETGTGLGLAIAKKSVDDHEGTIAVASKQGEGTTFTVTLPTVKDNDE
ncbi:MAG: ATP-binding protein [Pyrinomonadaceae bacterium]